MAEHPKVAPGKGLAAHSLSREVVSCVEAASAKGIPLRNELKTLVLLADSQVYAVHLPGDMRASLRKIKSFLNVDQVFLLPSGALKALGLTPGTVCALIEPVWSMPQLISANVLDLPFVSTNNGTRSGYFTFDPVILLGAPTTRIGDFEQASSDDCDTLSRL